MSTERAVVLAPRADFVRAFDADVAALPRNCCLVGWSAGKDAWFASPERVASDAVWCARALPLLRFLDERVLAGVGADRFWFVLCFHDGWRERIAWTDRYRWVAPGNLEDVPEWRGAPGELPALSATHRWVACFGAHRGDPSAFLLPEAHWLAYGHHRALFDAVLRDSTPWDARRPRAVYAGGDHGEAANFLAPAPAGAETPRRWLRQVVADAALPVDVTLGGRVPHATQMTYRWILDVDGFARTWDAWAWKMASGSVVLSPASPWESTFTREFAPWEHYVPLANDFSDLAARLAWCREHDDECRRIAQAARARAIEVYEPASVAADLARRLAKRLASDAAAANDARSAPGPGA